MSIGWFSLPSIDKQHREWLEGQRGQTYLEHDLERTEVRKRLEIQMGYIHVHDLHCNGYDKACVCVYV